MRKPHKTQFVERLDASIICPLKSEYDRANQTLEGAKKTRPPTALELPEQDDVVVRVVGTNGRWVKFGQHWMRIHELSRSAMYIPQLEDEGPELATLANRRITFKLYGNGKTDHVTDDWRSSVPLDDSRNWIGTTLYFNSEPEKVSGELESSGSSSSGTRPASMDILSPNLGTVMNHLYLFMMAIQYLSEDKMGFGAGAIVAADFIL